jgi:hypothetical protein
LFLLAKLAGGFRAPAVVPAALWRASNGPAYGMYMPPLTCRVSPVM